MKLHSKRHSRTHSISNSIVFLGIFAGTVFFSCNEGSDAIPDKSTSDIMEESELPRGRPVLEDARPTSLPGNAGGAYGNNGQERNKTVHVEDLPEEVLRKKFQRLLMFHADDTMEVNMPRLATLILSKDATIQKLQVEVLDESEATDKGIKLDTLMEFGNKMKARLISFGDSRLDNSFNIEPLGDDEQSFRGERKKILWQWKITPLKPGKQELKLSIQIIEKDGEAVSLPARNIPVVIYAKPESFISKAGTFFEKYWQFLITAIMIPIITAYVGSLIRMRNLRQNTPPQAAGTVSTKEPARPSEPAPENPKPGPG